MALINMVRWAPDGDKTIYAWRYPHTNLSTYTQLVVAESQEAVLFSKGEILGKFGPGKHTLNTENLPVLRRLYGIPFGFKNPFTAEVWFVNKLQPYNIDWKLSRMTVHDVDYNTQLPLTASGRYGLRIVDAEKFLVKIVGTRSIFAEEDLTEQFEGEFSTKTKSVIVQYMLKHKIGFKQISAYLDTISEYLCDVMAPFWDNSGLELTKFYVTSIDIDDSTEDGRRVKQAIAQQSSMSITGHTWQQEQLFGTANNAINGMSGNGGLLGGLMAINMMNGIAGNSANGMMQPQFQQPVFSPDSTAEHGVQNQTRMVYCSNCAKKFPNNVQFCPHCGNKYNPCPKCGTDNDTNARRCISCGVSLQQTQGNCPCCNAPLVPGSTFCTNCGTKVVSGDNCTRCGMVLPHNVKFCPKCGNKR